MTTKALLDAIQLARIKTHVRLSERDAAENMQNIAAMLPAGSGFVYNKVVYLPPADLAKLQSFNQLYASCLISRITEIQSQMSEEETILIKDLFLLIPNKIDGVIINNNVYHRTGKNRNPKGTILREEDILSNITDD